MEGFELLPIVSDRDFDLVQFSKKYRAFRIVSPECRVSVWLCDELFFEMFVCMSHQDLAFMPVLMKDILIQLFFLYYGVATGCYYPEDHFSKKFLPFMADTLKTWALPARAFFQCLSFLTHVTFMHKTANRKQVYAYSSAL